MSNKATLALRLDDCLDGYPEDGEGDADAWKLIP